jgi:uncharacterized membrane protein
LSARVLTGALCGACICAAGGASLAVGAVLGALGGLAGAFGGYQVRTRLVKAVGVRDVFVAIPEDLVAIVFACVLVTRG